LAKPAAGGVTTSYVTGDRTASITVTVDLAVDAGTLDNLVDGQFGTNTSDSIVRALVPVGGHWFKFDFGTAKVVNEARWYESSGGASSGTWKWQGSNDDSSYTDIGSTFVLALTTPETQTSLNGNTTAYRYYRLLGVGAGDHSGGNWIEEIEFKQN